MNVLITINFNSNNTHVQSNLALTLTSFKFNAGRGRKNFEAKNRVIAKSALYRGSPMGGFVTMKRPNAGNCCYF